jgi:divalent metal cation (Fe/Co/Zn/Cd) transporter
MIEAILGTIVGAVIFFAGVYFGWNMGHNEVVIQTRCRTTHDGEK